MPTICELADRKIDVFTISPRVLDTKLYWENIQTTIRLSEKYGCTGNLIFTGNDIYVECWLVAQEIFSRSRSLSPLVAVNPLYMHPFTAAKMISSFGYLYGRKTFLNCVTGTSTNDLVALDDGKTSHDERYERLVEYIQIIEALLSAPGPVTFRGRFYRVENLQIRPRLPESLLPEFYVAGASGAALRSAEAIGATLMRMAKPTLGGPPKCLQPLTNEGIYLGMISREQEMEAWARAKQLFTDDQTGKEMLDYSMSNTDAVWKKQLKEYADASTDEKTYWMKPFRNFKADCPYFIGSYDQLADVIVNYVASGVKSFILDLLPVEEEYLHVYNTFQLAARRLKAMGETPENQNQLLNINFNYEI